MKSCAIYVLIDPRTNEIKYVGRTTQKPERRLYQHIYKSKKRSHARAKWIRELAREGLRPLMRVIEVVPYEDGHDKEKEHTIRLLSDGRDLLNDGIGRGGCNYPKKSIEWTPELDALLGTMADSRIAEMLGAARKTVSYRRENLGIPAAYDRTRNTPPPPMGGHNKIDLPQEIIDKLGTMSDQKLAKEAGVGKKRIMQARHKRGIPSWSEIHDNPTQYKKGNYPERWLK